MNLWLKRLFDIILSVLGLIFSAWLWAFIWILIIINDGFPVLISQKRIGKHGKIFKYYKFRSMRKYALEEKISAQAYTDDPRITVFGRFLRKTALDELPQLLNIFKGDMSFVGPRPLLPFEIEVCANCGSLDVTRVPGFEKRIKVQPGLTGIAQIWAPRDVLRRHKFKYDLLYIRKMSCLLDVKLIVISFLITFAGTWDRRGAKLALLKKQRQSG